MKNVPNTDLIHILDGKTNPEDVIHHFTESGLQEDPFYVFNVGEIVQKHKEWKMKLPRVQPFYAVKCNDCQIVLEVLAALGTGFDCASKAEINKVLNIGVDADRIIFANPAKPASHIRHAKDVSVDTMTFDNECEIHKIKALYPDARLVLRIRCDAEVSQCPLGMKFGCEPTIEGPHLLRVAASVGLNVIGISFHVGSGCGDPPVFKRAIAAARKLFDYGVEIGFNMNLLDIGGGYPGNKGSSIDKIAQVVNDALDEFFPVSEGVQVIAEPGRFYVAAAYTLAANIHSKRVAPSHTMYYINDGVYGSFNCVLYDHAVVNPQPLNQQPFGKMYPSSVWGPTCDGLDQVVNSCFLPQLDIGDWIIFPDMGAYTLPVASPFNGFPVPKVYAVIDEGVWLLLKDSFPLTENHFTLAMDSDEESNWDDITSIQRCPSPLQETFTFNLELVEVCGSAN